MTDSQLKLAILSLFDITVCMCAYTLRGVMVLYQEHITMRVCGFNKTILDWTKGPRIRYRPMLLSANINAYEIIGIAHLNPEDPLVTYEYREADRGSIKIEHHRMLKRIKKYNERGFKLATKKQICNKQTETIDTCWEWI